jgi:hypothetical protein
MFFNNRKLMKRMAIVISIVIVLAMLLGLVAPYL